MAKKYKTKLPRADAKTWTQRRFLKSIGHSTASWVNITGEKLSWLKADNPDVTFQEWCGITLERLDYISESVNSSIRRSASEFPSRVNARGSAKVTSETQA